MFVSTPMPVLEPYRGDPGVRYVHGLSCDSKRSVGIHVDSTSCIDGPVFALRFDALAVIPNVVRDPLSELVRSRSLAFARGDAVTLGGH